MLPAYSTEVPGQHSGTGFRCAECGGEYGGFTMGCRRCAQRHGWRRRKSRQLTPNVAPTKRTWRL